jgi:amino acid transporter
MLDESRASMSFHERVSIVRPIEMNSEATSDASGANDDYEAVPRKEKKKRFTPVFGLASLILLGFGNTIGSGVFTITGVAAKLAGPAVFIGFIIAGMIALLTAMVYAEFAAIIPKSGSAYIYTYTTFGELPAWVVGWNQNLRYAGSVCV